MKDPELKAAYEALGPKFRREVEMAQQRREQRGAHTVVIASRETGRNAVRATPHNRPLQGAARR